ncbi:MAG: restriction endonuclease subunit S [Deltaproteobacteria bacterium]|nr:restriction endonuclease subunit S [Deltaproteobacteria bacterium]
MKTFNELFEFLPKSGKKAKDGAKTGEYPFYTSSSMLSKYINDFDYIGQSLIFGTGGNASIHYQQNKFSTTNDCLIAQAKPEVDIHTFYAYLYLLNNIRVLEKGFKGAGLKHISKKYISKIPIPIPKSYDDQIRITTILSSAENLIAKRKESIELFDELLKSAFWEMFGNPINNEKNWDLKKLPDLVSKKKNSLKRGPFGGSLKKEIFVDKGYLVYEQYHALNNDYSFKRYYINQSDFEKLEDFEVKGGDILISCSGVYLGKLSIVPQDALPGIINQALLKITLNTEEMLQIFFIYVFSHPSFRTKYITPNRGAGIPNIPPMSVMKKINFITPPLLLQNKFAQIVEKITSIKSKYKQSLTELENLYGALSQRAFKGELDLSKIPIKKDIEIKPEPVRVATSVKAQLKVQKPFSKQELLNIIKSRNGNPFNFDELWDDLEKADFIKMPTYDEIKEMIFMMLENKEPVLSQSFDEDRKEIVLKGI